MVANVNTITQPVAPSFPMIYYCDPGDILRRVSTEGVDLHIQDFGAGALAGESGDIEDSIWDASDIVNLYLYQHYRPEDLVKSTFINRRATDIAVKCLFERRGNIASGSVLKRYDDAIAWLTKISEQVLELAGVPMRFTSAPAWSNIRYDLRYPTFRIRVERPISEKSPTSYSQSIDMTAEYDYSI